MTQHDQWIRERAKHLGAATIEGHRLVPIDELRTALHDAIARAEAQYAAHGREAVERAHADIERLQAALKRIELAATVEHLSSIGYQNALKQVRELCAAAKLGRE